VSTIERRGEGNPLHYFQPSTHAKEPLFWEGGENERAVSEGDILSVPLQPGEKGNRSSGWLSYRG